MMQPFSPLTRSWFANQFTEPTPVQAAGWAAIAGGEHALLIAPTGSGKTLAAFLWALDRLVRLSPEAEVGFRVVYLSPLRALVYDVERNLRGPLIGLQHEAERVGEAVRRSEVAIRTGDTPARDRERQLRRPPDILVTTPESFYLMLGTRRWTAFRMVHTVIVDELHAVAGTKRGAHLALSLERLAALAETDPQRIGLSATVQPAAEAARFLGGDRPVQVIDRGERPQIDLAVTVPVPDRDHPPEPVGPGGAAGGVDANAEAFDPDAPDPGLLDGVGDGAGSIEGDDPNEAEGSILGALYRKGRAGGADEKGLWPSLYPELLAAMARNRTTLVFVNNRGLCERLAQKLNEWAEAEWVRAHHGSVSPARRAAIEEELKLGRLKGIVATSSLELGIDMGAVDEVLMVESPGSVARGLQRIGRAGHQVGEVSRGRIFPKFKGDLLESTVVAAGMERGGIEALRVPRNPLDVLAQHLVAVCLHEAQSAVAVLAWVRRAYPFQGLSDAAYRGVLDMLTGAYAGDAFADLKPLLRWDHAADTLSARPGAALVSRLNAGTIPDRGTYAVQIAPDGPRVGELDEEMVFETRLGDLITLGASTWRVEAIARDRVRVTPAPGEVGRLPFWRGTGPGRPVDLGQAIGALSRRLGPLDREAAIEAVQADHPVDRYAAENLVDYLHEQRAQAGVLPTDETVVVERFRDELGDWRVCLLTPFGSPIHAPWAMAVQRALEREAGFEVQVLYTDDGIVLRFADGEALPSTDILFPDPETLEDQVVEQLAETALFTGLFRENAGRALLLARRSAKRRQPLWSQRIKAQQLLATVRQFPAFPIVLETYRQCLQDVFDLPGLKQVLGAIRGRRIRVREVETPMATPFARQLIFAYVASFIYEQDAPLAERRAQALTLDRSVLRDLLGQEALRTLIDPEVLAELEAELAGLAEDRRAYDADTLHDRLRRLGDLTPAELQARCAEAPQAWLDELARSRRAASVRIHGEIRWIAAEDAGLYQAALGVMPPPGLPERFLAVPEAPLRQLLQRYARSHGPFRSEEPATRYGLDPGRVEVELRALEAAGDLTRGELRPEGHAREWCDWEVLRRLKRRTLARLRAAIAPVDARALAAFLPQWQGLTQPGLGLDGLLEALVPLEGLALPWSALTMAILPARIRDFRLDLLDRAAASGEIVWVGRGALGSRDGRIAIYRRETAPRLLRAAEPERPETPAHEAIIGHLETRGASFYTELEHAARQADPALDAAQFKEALWDLVWAGAITNDTFQPLRALGQGRTRGGGRRGRRGDPMVGGRWSRVSELRAPDRRDTEQLLALTHGLLERYGLVSREMVLAEDLPGGFGPVYKTLGELEETGQVRRGHFVEGLSGAQFGHPGAVDRLRAARPEDLGPEDLPAEEAVFLLAAVDPANPYGALLPWPEPASPEAPRPKRSVGSWVVLVYGDPVVYLPAGGKHLTTFGQTGAWLEAALQPLTEVRRREGRQRTLEQVDGQPIRETALYDQLLALGFAADHRGILLEPGNSSSSTGAPAPRRRRTGVPPDSP